MDGVSEAVQQAQDSPATPPPAGQPVADEQPQQAPEPAARPAPAAEPPAQTANDANPPAAAAAEAQPSAQASAPAAAGAVTAATAADVITGAQVRDTAGGVVGTVETVDADSAIVSTGTVRADVPIASFGRNGQGLVLSMTRAQLEAAAQARTPTP